MDLVQAVERLGGWAVVVWMVLWLTKRWEVRMAEIVKVTMERSDAAIKILENQSQILDELRRDTALLAEAMQKDAP